MDQSKLNEALLMMHERKYFFIASADKNGLPHLTVGSRITPHSDDLPEVYFWPCPVTLANLQWNKNVSLIVWDEERDKGFQLLGMVEKMEEYVVVDRSVPGVEVNQTDLHVCWRLEVRVLKVLVFTQEIHSDSGL